MGKKYWKDLKIKRQAKTEEAKKNFFKLNGYKHIDDFSDDERKAIIQDSIVNLMGKEKLSQKYNTFPFVITRIVRMAGLSVTPDDLSKYPDYPKKSDDMSQDEYKKVLKKYWKSKENKKAEEKAKEKKKAADVKNDYPKRTEDM